MQQILFEQRVDLEQEFLEKLKHKELAQYVFRRQWAMAITTPDMKLFVASCNEKNNSSDYLSNFKRNGQNVVERAFFVAASYHHLVILTDQIVDGHVVSDLHCVMMNVVMIGFNFSTSTNVKSSSEVTTHSLPSGEIQITTSWISCWCQD